MGCIIVYKDSIIARGYNMCEKLQDPTAHAEMTTLTSACNHLQSKYLNKCMFNIQLIISLQYCKTITKYINICIGILIY